METDNDPDLRFVLSYWRFNYRRVAGCPELRLPCWVELDDQLLITFRELRRMRSWMT